MVSFNETLATQWRIAFIDEDSREQPDPQLRANAAANYFQYQAEILKLAKARLLTDAGEIDRIVTQVNERVDKIRALFKQAKYDELITRTHALIVESKEAVASLNETHKNLYLAIKDEERVWNGRFVWAYLAGAALTGVGVLRRQLQANGRHLSARPGD